MTLGKNPLATDNGMFQQLKENGPTRVYGNLLRAARRLQDKGFCKVVCLQETDSYYALPTDHEYTPIFAKSNSGNVYVNYWTSRN